MAQNQPLSLPWPPAIQPPPRPDATMAFISSASILKRSNHDEPVGFPWPAWLPVSNICLFHLLFPLHVLGTVTILAQRRRKVSSSF